MARIIRSCSSLRIAWRLDSDRHAPFGTRQCMLSYLRFGGALMNLSRRSVMSARRLRATAAPGVAIRLLPRFTGDKLRQVPS